MPVEMITGNQAAALAVQRAGVDLVSAYPITPQTAIVEDIAGFWARGEAGGEFVSVESEYAALSYCCGARGRGENIYRHLFARPRLHARNDPLDCRRAPAGGDGRGEPGPGAPGALTRPGRRPSQRDTGWISFTVPTPGDLRYDPAGLSLERKPAITVHGRAGRILPVAYL